MRQEIVKVTPRIAEAWLQKNVINRPLRPGVVDTYANAMRRGEWQLSHQGVAFDEQGLLADGQHRLNAVLESGCTVEMVVWRNCPPDMFNVVDTGARRSNSDILGVSTALAATGAFLLKIAETNLRGAVTASMATPYIDAFRPYYDRLLAGCLSTTKVWSSSPVRVAAVLRLADGEDAEYVRQTYHALVMRDFDLMPPIARATFKKQMDGQIKGQRDLFVRTSDAFTKSRANIRILKAANETAILEHSRAVIRDVFDGKEKARRTGPKIVKASRDYSAAV